MAEEPNVGHIGPTPAGVLAAWAAAAVVIGWLVRFLSLSWGFTEPKVTWLAVSVIAFLAAAVAGVALHTSRTRRAGRRFPAHRAVNRLVLGKTCAILGAAAAGGYLGFSIAHLGVGGQSAHTQLITSAVAAVAGVALMVAALTLEHACRIDPEGQ